MEIQNSQTGDSPLCMLRFELYRMCADESRGLNHFLIYEDSISPLNRPAIATVSPRDKDVGIAYLPHVEKLMGRPKVTVAGSVS